MAAAAGPSGQFESQGACFALPCGPTVQSKSGAPGGLLREHVRSNGMQRSTRAKASTSQTSAQANFGTPRMKRQWLTAPSQYVIVDAGDALCTPAGAEISAT